MKGQQRLTDSFVRASFAGFMTFFFLLFVAHYEKCSLRDQWAHFSQRYQYCIHLDVYVSCYWVINKTTTTTTKHLWQSWSLITPGCFFPVLLSFFLYSSVHFVFSSCCVGLHQYMQWRYVMCLKGEFVSAGCCPSESERYLLLSVFAHTKN